MPTEVELREKYGPLIESLTKFAESALDDIMVACYDQAVEEVNPTNGTDLDQVIALVMKHSFNEVVINFTP